jgi:hypothetical protein
MKKYLANLFTAVTTIVLMVIVVEAGEAYDCPTLFTIIDDFMYEVLYLKMDLSWEVYQGTYLFTMFAIYLGFVEIVKFEVKYYFNKIKNYLSKKEEKTVEVRANFIKAD